MSDEPVLAVVGHPNKGKSSLVSALAQDDGVAIGPRPRTTTRCRRYPARLDGVPLYTLVDTPGFERARRTLEWLETWRQAHPGSPLPEAVRAFLDSAEAVRACPQEAELLRPLADGAAVIYVVDGAKPVSPEYEAEMEILRWTGRPRMGVINPIGAPRFEEDWREAMGPYFSTVRVFNPLEADFAKTLDLLGTFGGLVEAWRGPLEEAVRILREQRARQHRRCARILALLIADALSLKVARRLGEGDDPKALRPALAAELRDALRDREARAHREVEEVFGHLRLEREEGAPSVGDEDLFSETVARAFGLRRSQLATVGAVTGGGVGLALDVTTGGLAAGIPTLIGTAAGGVAGFLGADRLGDMRILGRKAGTRTLEMGLGNPNLAFVLLGRGLAHHAAVALRSHARRDRLVLEQAAAAGRTGDLAPADRTQLARWFRDLRAGEARAVQATEALTSWLVDRFLGLDMT